MAALLDLRPFRAFPVAPTTVSVVREFVLIDGRAQRCPRRQPVRHWQRGVDGRLIGTWRQEDVDPAPPH